MEEVINGILIREVETKNIMTKSSLPVGGYSVNPYVGCTHACKYCYASFMKRFTGHKEEWGTFLDVKHWPEIKNPKKYAGQRVVIGSVTDGYNPQEEQFGNTRKLLEQLIGSDADILICTKSDLVVRDIDLLKKLGRVTVSWSINTLDENFKNDMDSASSIEHRIAAMKQVYEAGIRTVIPMWNGKRGSQKGMEFRTNFGELNSFVLDSLRGLDETIQYGQGEKRKEQMSEHSKNLAGMQESLSKMEGSQRSFTNMVILLASFGMLALTIWLYDKGAMGFEGILTCTIAMMGSFGPVVALSSLSNNLNQTLASGERVLSLLEETPLVEEIPGDVETSGAESMEHEFTGAEAEHVTFAYDNEVILDNYSLKLQPGKITGIHGASGSGKSTLLKLLMRFWDVQDGSVSVDGTDVRKIPTKHLRDMESYVTQETHLFHDSIANNIAIAKPGASREEIMEAAKKASIHDFIMTLPKGYDTEVGELGDTLSGGEKQRIGIARAFLHECPLILLDEPTSNLDSLNEGIILKSLKESAKKKTVVLVSHRVSTMNVADVVYEMENGRIS